MPRSDLAHREELVDVLLVFFMDGFCSGAASVLLDNGLQEKLCDEYAVGMVKAARRDPAVMEMFRNSIRERLSGTDSGGHTLRATALGEE